MDHEPACDLCGELINERVKLLRCVACSTPGCRVRVHRHHVPEFCRKRGLKRKRKDQFAAWICFECRSNRSSSSQRSLATATHEYDDAISVGAIDEPASDSSLASSVFEYGCDMSMDSQGNDSLRAILDTLGEVLSAVHTLQRQVDSSAVHLSRLGQEVAALRECHQQMQQRDQHAKEKLALAAKMLVAELDSPCAAFVTPMPTISRSNSEIYTGPDTKNAVVCVGGKMEVAALESTSPTVEHVANAVQDMQISSTSSTYSGTVQQVLNQVLGKLKLQEGEIKKTNEKLEVLVKKDLIEGLKEQSPLFKMLFKEIAWTGSYYEGLKISKPDEFDLNIVLRMPDHNNQIEVEARSDLPGYVTVKNFGAAIKSLVEVDLKYKPVHSELSKWAENETGNLSQAKLLCWMEGIVNKFANKYNQDATPHEKIKVVKTGPAMTMKIGKLSIDVVAVFAFSCEPPQPIKTPRPMNRQWVIVPKPQKEDPSISDAWRVNFYQFEKEILHGFGNIKPAIKLVKKLRDSQDMKSLFSYSIKTAAIWMKESGDLTSKDTIDSAFLKLLKKVKNYLEAGVLPCYWAEKCNILKMGEKERQNWACRLANLIKKFESNLEVDPTIIGEIIMPSESVQEAVQQQQDNNNCNVC